MQTDCCPECAKYWGRELSFINASNAPKEESTEPAPKTQQEANPPKETMEDLLRESVKNYILKNYIPKEGISEDHSKYIKSKIIGMDLANSGISSLYSMGTEFRSQLPEQIPLTPPRGILCDPYAGMMLGSKNHTED